MKKHAVDDAEFFVTGAPWLQTALSRYGLRFRHETYDNRNAVERIYHEIKRRTSSFSNAFSTSETDEKLAARTREVAKFD